MTDVTLENVKEEVENWKSITKKYQNGYKKKLKESNKIKYNESTMLKHVRLLKISFR